MKSTLYTLTTAAVLKLAAPIFEEQRENPSGTKRHVPDKVIETANAIRRDKPETSDESAYRIAWSARHKKHGKEKDEDEDDDDKHEKAKRHIERDLKDEDDEKEEHRGGGEEDPTGIRAKLQAIGERRAHSHPKRPIKSPFAREA